jgi:CheY-like chemotaxis protein
MPHRHVLVVDDDEAIREIAQVSLEMVAGWDVTTASDGVQGCERATSERPDAILLDVVMPGLDGPATVARLQAADSTRTIPVVLLTAKVADSERARFAEMPGVAGVLTKPFDPMQLPDQIAELLHWTRR